MPNFLYRRGDGNDGNFPRYVVELKPTDSPYAALKALVCNDYIAGRAVRRYIAANIEIDGEAEFGIHGTVYEGRGGETAFGAAWLTAELQPLDDADSAHYAETGLGVQEGQIGHCTYRPWRLRELLDRGATVMFRKESRV